MLSSDIITIIVAVLGTGGLAIQAFKYFSDRGSFRLSDDVKIRAELIARVGSLETRIEDLLRDARVRESELRSEIKSWQDRYYTRDREAASLEWRLASLEAAALKTTAKGTEGKTNGTTPGEIHKP